MGKRFFLIILFLAMTTFSACSSPELTLEPEHLEMLVSLDGEEDDYYEEMTLKCDGRIVDGRRARWHSDNPDVASVDRHGWVTSKGVGLAVITARYKGTTAECSISVQRKITSDTRSHMGNE